MLCDSEEHWGAPGMLGVATLRESLCTPPSQGARGTKGRQKLAAEHESKE